MTVPPNNTQAKQLFDLIESKNPFQKKALTAIEAELNPSEWDELERTLLFYRKHMTIEELADAYLLVLTDTLEQTKYFVEHRRYRYSTFAEVGDLVYHNSSYMSRYMVGLSLSSYLWGSHLQLSRWFRGTVRRLDGGAYLEIGPGHGKYFCAAISEGRFRHYTAVDLSESSVEQTKAYTAYFMGGRNASWDVIQEDFYQYTPPAGPYDCLVAMEVLEHLEDPQRMLERMVLCSHPGGHVLLTVPVNAPAIDHIYLFRSTQEVEDMVQAAGIDIIDRCYVTAGKHISLEKAVQKNYAIVVGILGKIQ